MRNASALIGGLTLIAVVGWLLPVQAAEPPTVAAPEMPTISGDWSQIAAPPTREQFPEYHKPRLEPVDFTIFRAADKTWQLISCVRGTTLAGGGRLLCRWEAKNLTDKDWSFKGVFWKSDVDLGQQEGKIQAPHCVQIDGKHYLFYNSNGAYCLVSDDGKTFKHLRTSQGELRFFDMPRDVMLFDNRPRDGLWYAFYTDIVPGKYNDRKNHTVSFRTSKALLGPWSDEKTDIGVVSPTPSDAYTFVYAESPFVVFRNGWYYRFEQMNVLVSQNLSKWNDEILTTLTPGDPRQYLAPEIIVDGDKQYIAGYRYRKGEGGIFMAELTWQPGKAPAKPAATSAAKPAPAPLDILVIATHPDDEVIGCTELILQAVAAKKRVGVVIVTNGDGFPAAAAALAKKPQEELMPADFVELAAVRQRHSIKGAEVLGVANDDLMFLGYPDSGLKQIYDAKDATPFKQKLTGKSETYGPVVQDYHSLMHGKPAPYVKASLIDDLAEIIKARKPKEIYTISESDPNPDHSTTYRYSQDAAPAAEFRGSFFSYLIHRKVKMPAPDVRLPLDAKQFARKKEIITLYQSRMSPVHDELAEKFTLPEEVFWLKR